MKATIEKDLRGWSKEVLETPNPYLLGLPACPFAKQAWKQNKVLVVETEDLFKEAENFCRDFNNLSKDLIVVVSYKLPKVEDLESLVKYLHNKYPTLHCMQFHPDYGAEEADLDFLTDNSWESKIKDPYCMLFIQDFKLVVEASDKLISLGYYNNYPSDEYEELVVKRKRRLTHGNETPSNEVRSNEIQS